MNCTCEYNNDDIFYDEMCPQHGGQKMTQEEFEESHYQDFELEWDEF